MPQGEICVAVVHNLSVFYTKVAGYQNLCSEQVIWGAVKVRTDTKSILTLHFWLNCCCLVFLPRESEHS